jgi:hypothetical protein
MPSLPFQNRFYYLVVRKNQVIARKESVGFIQDLGIHSLTYDPRIILMSQMTV